MITDRFLGGTYMYNIIHNMHARPTACFPGFPKLNHLVDAGTVPSPLSINVDQFSSLRVVGKSELRPKPLQVHAHAGSVSRIRAGSIKLRYPNSRSVYSAFCSVTVHISYVPA